MPYWTRLLLIGVAGLLVIGLTSYLVYHDHRTMMTNVFYSPQPTLPSPEPASSPLPSPSPSPTFDPNKVQGSIVGVVKVQQGNCMPMYNQPLPKTCITITESRNVYLYDSLSTADFNGNTLLSGHGNLLKTFHTSTDGAYRFDVTPGRYTILVDDNGKKYCNFFTGDGRACSVGVTEGVEQFDILITSAATY